MKNNNDDTKTHKDYKTSAYDVQQIRRDCNVFFVVAEKKCGWTKSQFCIEIPFNLILHLSFRSQKAGNFQDILYVTDESITIKKNVILADKTWIFKARHWFQKVKYNKVQMWIRFKLYLSHFFSLYVTLTYTLKQKFAFNVKLNIINLVSSSTFFHFQFKLFIFYFSFSFSLVKNVIVAKLKPIMK